MEHHASTEELRREKKEKRKSRSDRSVRSERDDENSRVRRHKSSRKPKLSSGDTDSISSHSRKHRKDREHGDDISEMPATSSITDFIPEMSRVGSNAPYPSFSKAHSKECVRSKDDVSRSPRDPLTPDTTDLSKSGRRRSKSVDQPSRKASSSSRRAAELRPPTPPDTDFSKQQDDSAVDSRLESIVDSKSRHERPRSSLSVMSRSDTKDSTLKSRVSTKSSKSKASSQATYVPARKLNDSILEDQESAMTEDKLRRKKSSSRSTTSSSSRVKVKKKRKPKVEDIEEQSPESAPDSSPKTPTTNAPQFPPPPPMSEDKTPTQELPFHHSAIPIPPIPPPMPSQTPMTDFTGLSAATGMSAAPPPPPPPPPPPLNIQEPPRVDYLLANGGLPQPVPRRFVSALPKHHGHHNAFNPPLQGCETLFSPFFNLLEQYQSVLHKHGSVAVATGHRTVARRLLDRLENVFSRDLSPVGCSCVICESDASEHRGLGWGEVLERVSGRMELPKWPPFDIAELGSKPDDKAELPHRPGSPINLDPDIAPEFREHYIRQTKKVRASVDKWLTNNEDHTPLPQDIDDDTLSFTILTSLSPENRPYFNSLLAGSKELQPALRAPTPMKRPRIDFIVKIGLSIQRLYRLSHAPRDAETALYMVKNPSVHDLLVTISDINPSEWEILTSGRFDGFLWSGADEDATTPTPDAPSRGATPAFPTRGITPGIPVQRSASAAPRITTPFNLYSRGPTPASFVSMAGSNSPRAAVSNDEETELAVLAEVEREIYQGMEALEDAFEKLHHRAEIVRTALRNRGAALSMSLQQRRAAFGHAGNVDILPGSGNSMYSGYERPPWAPSTDGDNDSQLDAGESDDWGGDDWEIRPDDSASNVASNRHRKVKRRDERRTPAPIKEDEEET